MSKLFDIPPKRLLAALSPHFGGLQRSASANYRRLKQNRKRGIWNKEKEIKNKTEEAEEEIRLGKYE